MTETNQTSQVRLQTIDADYAGQRIDNYLIAQLKGVPKSLVYRILRKGEVRVNKKRAKPEYKLQAGDIVRIPPVRVAEANPLPSVHLDRVQALQEQILYEDDILLVINKPAGLAVHGGSGLQFGLIESLRALRPQAKQLELVHRLDRDTSGCILIAKRRSALRHLHEQLRSKTMDKQYLALVRGQWQEHVKFIAAPLQKNTLKSGERVVRVDAEGKPSETRFRVIERFGQKAKAQVQASCTLVEASPITGRTHQIRVHALQAGHPIAYDDKYGDREFDQQLQGCGLKRLFLHAHQLSFQHPQTLKTITVNAPLDHELTQTLRALGGTKFI
ncbi:MULTISPECIES: 23S rRNA pseudouridine(955/2504/2580) synthase RluC [Pseudidiomarina]|uniref:Pseudouridine synthase n=3 Tax=Pseudidiomarina TaxID=2800384 RepID=A0A368V850_9GAMM|nr:MULTISPECIES: 23S rRNA pseudouridine(955/2504/2580) synthase RluC [Pseudidiomarina]MDX1525146.1 23S rRNA pseudouridine(955/2504/2580) synthase RluC [Pseudidiomarina maritima]PWW15207.1 ribosomal large subunit pseudouridine synthase C [Pseudidiomarina maritima]RBP89631.1 ribosomal large subunit pseudouridine synthase C [Pseudidiomarina tainanensis]RCW35181.1 ribosomal large subunit pseudouridine synthase C [Pseudidiomarina tainanensis]